MPFEYYDEYVCVASHVNFNINEPDMYYYRYICVQQRLRRCDDIMMFETLQLTPFCLEKCKKMDILMFSSVSGRIGWNKVKFARKYA